MIKILKYQKAKSMKLLLIIFFLFTNLIADNDEYHEYKHINKELSHLELSSKQNKQIKKLLKKFRVKLKEYQSLKKEIEHKRTTIFLRNKLDINELNNLNLILDTKAHSIENDFLRQIHPMLNKEQRVKFIDYFDDWEVE